MNSINADRAVAAATGRQVRILSPRYQLHDAQSAQLLFFTEAIDLMMPAT